MWCSTGMPVQISTLEAWRSDSDHIDIARYLEGIVIPLLCQRVAGKRANAAGGSASTNGSIRASVSADDLNPSLAFTGLQFSDSTARPPLAGRQ